MFGQNKPGQQTGFSGFSNLAATSTTAGTGFTFGSTTSGLGLSGTSGFTFGTQASQPSATASSTIGQTQAQGQNQGLSSFSFGNAASKPVFGTSAPSSAPSAAGSLISSGQVSQTLNLGTAATSVGAKPTGFTFGLQASQPSTASATTSTLPAFGSLTSTTSAAPPAFGTLSAGAINKSSAATGFTFGNLQPAASTQTSTLTLGPTATAAATTQKTAATAGFTFGQTAATPLQGTTQPISLLGATSQPASTSSTTLGFLGAAKTSTTVQPLTIQPTTISAAKTTVSLQPTTSATSTSASTEKPFTYKQLEDIINKWVQELEEQEMVFLNQAKQVNIWDRLLIENGEKITQLNYEMQRLKTDQSRLDRELDFILSQQQELEEILTPLEEEIKSQQSIPYMQHTDLEREKTYKMAENIDSQLKRMMHDIKDIISHINSSNANLKESDDPMTQIAKILNSHMDSLQWVDQNAVMLQRKVEDVSKQVESRRREHERSLRLTFD